MPFIQIKCRVCGKSASSMSHDDLFGTERIHTLTCGHMYTESLVQQKEQDIYESIVSLDGCRPRPYQILGAKFAEKANLRVLFGDEMGLGKTIQQLIVLKAHPEALPCGIICKSALKAQYAYEVMRWMGENVFCDTIESSKDFILPGMQFYIMSYDILRRFKVLICENGHKEKVKSKKDMERVILCRSCSHPMREFNELPGKLKELGVKSLILDECQLIKNTDSQRAQELRKIAENVEYILASSGGAIENNSAEFFSILNILKPERFRAKQTFINNFCDSYWNGYTYKVGGIKFPQRFKEQTEDFIIRRMRKDVAPELPAVNRQYQVCTQEDDGLGKAYNDMSNQMIDYMDQSSDSTFEKASNIMAYMQKLRHLVGLSKVPRVVDYVAEFLWNTDRKITIFTHHLDVMKILELKINALLAPENGKIGFNPATMLTSELSSDERLTLVQDFGTNPKSRVMIASTLSSAEGLNFQKWSDCCFAEQQWNPMKEKQGEDRFPRIGSTAEVVNAVYIVLLGTIDEYLIELKEQKRANCKSALDFEKIDWQESSIVREIANKVQASGRKKWTL